MFDLCYDCLKLGDSTCGNDSDCECYQPVGGIDYDRFNEDDDLDDLDSDFA